MDSNLTHNFLNGKHVVVFGAGYVGSALADLAMAGGATVTTLTRNPATCELLESRGFQVVCANLESADWHRRIGRPDLVLNSVSSGRLGVEGYRSSYVEGARSINGWGRQFTEDCPPLVYTSSTSVYPQGEGQSVDEDMPIDGQDEKGELLIEAEQSAFTWPGRTTVLRLAGIYGPSRHHLLDQIQASPAELPGRPDQILNLIHRRDIIAAIIAAWQHSGLGAKSVFNVVDDGATTRAEVVTWLADRLNVNVPTFSGTAMRGRRTNRPNRVISNAKLKSELGWCPEYPSFREGYESILLGA